MGYYLCYPEFKAQLAPLVASIHGLRQAQYKRNTNLGDLGALQA
jgi:hypothetical protein